MPWNLRAGFAQDSDPMRLHVCTSCPVVLRPRPAPVLGASPTFHTVRGHRGRACLARDRLPVVCPLASRPMARATSKQLTFRLQTTDNNHYQSPQTTMIPIYPSAVSSMRGTFSHPSTEGPNILCKAWSSAHHPAPPSYSENFAPFPSRRILSSLLGLLMIDARFHFQGRSHRF